VRTKVDIATCPYIVCVLDRCRQRTTRSPTRLRERVRPADSQIAPCKNDSDTGGGCTDTGLIILDGIPFASSVSAIGPAVQICESSDSPLRCWGNWGPSFLVLRRPKRPRPAATMPSSTPSRCACTPKPPAAAAAPSARLHVRRTGRRPRPARRSTGRRHRLRSSRARPAAA